MSELTLLILRIGFLVVLWLFIFSIVYALRSDLFGARVRRIRGGESAASAPTPAPASAKAETGSPQAVQAASAPAVTPSGGAMPSAGTTGPARTLVITGGVAAGTSLPLDDELVTIGRSSDSTLVIVDEYTSTYHARLSRQGDRWLLTDLGSTNGTKLDGQAVTDPITVPLFTPVSIGTTTFELRP